MSGTSLAPRLGARVLLLDPLDRVLLIHAKDPDDPGHHWWELPGGGLDEGEELADAARRELAEESGILLGELGRKLWVRESRFLYRGRAHHRIEHVFLGRTPSTLAQLPLKPTENEKAGLIERRWWPGTELRHCQDKLLPGNLPELVDDLLADRLSDEPLMITAGGQGLAAPPSGHAANPRAWRLHGPPVQRDQQGLLRQIAEGTR